MANYVKFRRGTPAAFQTVLDAGNAESDTLYFIYEEDESTADLYLGPKLIAGGSNAISATTLKGLQDVLLSSNLNETDCLVYDINESKWVNKPIADILPIFVGTIGETSGVAGLVPAPTASQTNMFLRSDGTWSEIVVASEALVLQTIVGTDETRDAAIARIVADYEISKGDIVILQEVIVGDLFQHISYVYNGTTWIAMDGNYSAENVYLSNDLIITADIGVQKLDGAGSKILETAGKNLKQVLDMLLAERALPTRTVPSVSVTATEAKEYEVGTSVVLDFSATLDAGSYTYGPASGVTATAWKAVFNGETINSNSGTFTAVDVTDGFNKKISVTTTHTKGAAPKDNLGNVLTDNTELSNCQIQSGDKIGYSNAVTGFRYTFYDSSVEPINLTSDNIRALSKVKSTNSSITNMPIIEGAKQVVIAVPVGRKVSKVTDGNAFGIDITTKFVKNVISVDGANEGFSKDYNVYVYSPDVALGANTYDITIANE